MNFILLAWMTTLGQNMLPSKVYDIQLKLIILYGCYGILVYCSNLLYVLGIPADLSSSSRVLVCHVFMHLAYSHT